MPSNENSPYIVLPADRNVHLWRYMDFTKYVYLLNRNSLFFCRADKIGDPYEGSVPQVDRDSWTRSHMKMRAGDQPIPAEVIKGMLRDESRFRRNMQKDTFLNCWHMSDHESLAMWKVYGNDDKSIAIRSTYERLHLCLPETVTMGLVEYIDFQSESQYHDGKQAASPFYYKRKAFEYEHEVRCSLQRFKWGVQDPDQYYDLNETGIDVPVDLDQLITGVVVSPASADWFLELVSEVTRHFGYSFRVEPSSLITEPQF